MSLDNIKFFRDSGKVDISLVEDFERENNTRFPENYKKFICDHNGAYLDKICFDFFCPRQNTTDSSSFFFLGFGLFEYKVNSPLEVM